MISWRKHSDVIPDIVALGINREELPPNCEGRVFARRHAGEAHLLKKEVFIAQAAFYRGWLEDAFVCVDGSRPNFWAARRCIRIVIS